MDIDNIHDKVRYFIEERENDYNDILKIIFSDGNNIMYLKNDIKDIYMRDNGILEIKLKNGNIQKSHHMIIEDVIVESPSIITSTEILDIFNNIKTKTDEISKKMDIIDFSEPQTIQNTTYNRLIIISSPTTHHIYYYQNKKLLKIQQTQ